MQPINQNKFEIPGLELCYVFLNPIQLMTGIQNKLQITKLDFFFIISIYLSVWRPRCVSRKVCVPLTNIVGDQTWLM